MKPIRFYFSVIMLCILSTNTLHAQQHDFSFVIIPDRTGGFRPGIFEETLEKITLLQPDFCIGIGDYVEGYADNINTLNRQWNEFDSITQKLKIPFYKTPGNHDYTGDLQKQLWKQKFGKDYLHFVYNNMLFLVLNSNDGDGVNISQTQLDYFDKVIKENDQVDWTFVTLHHPLWKEEDDKGFHKIQKALKGRQYTVFAGHTHVYDYQNIDGHDYITVATAGGSSDLRGNDFGEIDHLAYITVRNKKPAVSQLKLSSILAKNFTNAKRTAASNAVDALKNLKITILKNSAQEGGMLFSFINPTAYLVKYRVRFFNNPQLHIGEEKIAISVKPGEELNKYIAVKPLAQHGSDTIAYHVQVTSPITTKDSLQSVHESFITFKQNIPFLTADTAHHFLEKTKIVLPNKKDILLQYTDGNIFRDYTVPVAVNRTDKIGVRMFHKKSGSFSLPQYIYLHKMVLQNAVKVNKDKLSSGLYYTYHEGVFKAVPDFKNLKLSSKGISTDLDVKKIMQRDNNFAIQFTGYVKIPQDGLYKILLRSDDGSKIFIHGICIVDNDGSHSARTKSGFTALKKGLHPLRIDYFEDFDGEELSVQFIDESGKTVPVAFWH